LLIGPTGSILPNCAVEIKTLPEGKEKLYLDIPIDAREILPPGKSVTFTALLDQAVSLDRKTDWNGFISSLLGTDHRISVQGSVFTQVILTETLDEPLAKSPEFTLDLPQKNTAVALLIKNKTSSRVTDPWSLARLSRWFLDAPALKSQYASIISGVIDLMRLRTVSDRETRPALAWALRSAKGDPNILNALARLLNSPDWFTRLIALDTLGQLQGRQAEPLLQSFAVNDPDELVRQLATGYLLQQYSGKPQPKSRK
jgi:hypothetical protein